MKVLRLLVVGVTIFTACIFEGFSRQVQIVIPADVPAIENGTLYLMLFENEPNVADTPATLVDVASNPFTHTSGTETRVSLRVSGDVNDHWSTYVAVEGCRATPQGSMRVLWAYPAANQNTVEARYTADLIPCQSATSLQAP